MEEGEDTTQTISDKETKRVKKVVKKLLEQANLYEMSEKMLRNQASAKLGDVDLDVEPYRSLVRGVFEDFLEKKKKELEMAKKI